MVSVLSPLFAGGTEVLVRGFDCQVTLTILILQLRHDPVMGMEREVWGVGDGTIFALSHGRTLIQSK